MSSRKDELLAKKAKLAELKRQRELREEQRTTGGRQSIGGQTGSPGKSTEARRSEIDSLVSQLIDRERDTGAASPSKRSRPSSIYNTANVTPQNENEGQSAQRPMQSASTQTQTDTGASTIFEDIPAATSQPLKREYITYSKGVQTEETTDAAVGTDADYEKDFTVRTRRNTRRETERDEEVRAQLRQEIEQELKATQNGTSTNTATRAAQQRLPLRPLTSTEVNAVAASDEFVSFLERSTKVIERALDEDYDLLADYTRTAALNDEDDLPYSRTSKTSHSLREVHQLHSERHTRRRMISDLQYSPHFPELLLSAHTKNSSAPNEPHGLVLLWNTKAPSKPEYTFTAPTDVLSARFSPFHPNLVIGGCYSGQVCLWDTRISGRTGAAVQRTPQSGSHHGQTHPIYSVNIVGTPNAHNIITTSTDGVVCSWSVDMLTQPQEYLELTSPPPAKTEDIAPTAMAFPTADPTFFLVGTEEGSIYPCHRYDRAGAKAGVDSRLVYRGHTAPVMSAQFHPARGSVDLGDIMLTSSTDWSLKLWRVRPAASSASSTSMSGAPQKIEPILDIPREDLVYDAKWAPHRPGIFACVTGAGEVEVFDLNYDTEVPVARASPTRGTRDLIDKGFRGFQGLNKCAWEDTKGKLIAAGGLDGVISIFEAGKGLSGAFADAGHDEWMDVKRLVSKLESGKS